MHECHLNWGKLDVGQNGSITLPIIPSTGFAPYQVVCGRTYDLSIHAGYFKFGSHLFRIMHLRSNKSY